MGNNKLKLIHLPVLLLLILLICSVPEDTANADAAATITFGTIDYDTLVMQIYDNNNSVVYYSTDNSTWIELEGAYNSTNGSYSMDISWVPSSSDMTLYFKGNTVKTVKSITLPAQNISISVVYNKVEGEFSFDNVEEADFFQWRKATDYYWTTVDMEETSTSYANFITSMETLRTIGTKIIIRIPQEIGTGINNVGIWPSKEVTISLTARAAAPAIKVDSADLTLNTTTAMEYYDTTTSLWIECTKTMSIEELAPKALFENGAKVVTLMIRKFATESAPYSKSTYITIPGQAAVPTLGGNTSDVTYYYMNSKLMLQFNNASTTNSYEYAIIKSSATYEVATASWKTVTTSKLMTIANTTAPSGCTIYVRKKGTDANSTKSIALVLSSAVNSFTVTY